MKLADVAGVTAGDVWVLTGCCKGTVPAALVDEGPTAARKELARLVDLFGRDRVLVELWDHGDPLDLPRNDALAEVAAAVGVDAVATNNVHYATPAQRPLATALAAAIHPPIVRRNFHAYDAESLRRSLAHHLEIVAAVRAGDPGWARAVMTAHISNARAVMVRAAVHATAGTATTQDPSDEEAS